VRRLERRKLGWDWWLVLIVVLVVLVGGSCHCLDGSGFGGGNDSGGASSHSQLPAKSPIHLPPVDEVTMQTCASQRLLALCHHVEVAAEAIYAKQVGWSVPFLQSGYRSEFFRRHKQNFDEIFLHVWAPGPAPCWSGGQDVCKLGYLELGMRLGARNTHRRPGSII
jgi:hypothetical protein